MARDTWRAQALVAIDDVTAAGAIRAGVVLTLVDVHLTVCPLKPGQTCTVVAPGRVVTASWKENIQFGVAHSKMIPYQ